ncbi:hypothetical protein [Paenibacillus methanolicus]|uniref:SnoaL-like protein n=1 Tax=Paenibacillus methanolicus TaxID=582686 RepID=A0A5S5C147_9BACL|nr:hypothetical protein [Paenibacillus methanolicus]TYP73017.1 hypothetical protein BCM02_1071 [Paenibacillus methanolicus]
MKQKAIVAIFTVMALFIFPACGNSSNNNEQLHLGGNNSQTQLKTSDPVITAQVENDDKLVNEVTSLFKSYIKMTNEYDDSIADLYADHANITFKIQTDTEDISNQAFTGATYKQMIVHAMPVAKERGDTDTFSDIKYTVIANNTVKIEAMRYNHFYKYTSPYSSILEKSDTGEWLITAEMLEIHR